MAHSNQGRFFRHLESLRRQLAKAPGLPFSHLLDADMVTEAFGGLRFSQCLYAPTVTLWIFLSQVLDPVHCCLQAVARFLAYQVALGKKPCSSETGAYCQARQRLPDEVLPNLVRATGQKLHQRKLPTSWLWKGRKVKMVDGTMVSMPDTAANQKEYPQSKRQRPGVGFPLMRVVVVFTLAVGTVLDAAMSASKGKRSGERSLFRRLFDCLEAADVVLADRGFCSYLDIACLGERGIDVVLRLHQGKRADFRRGQRLGKNDHVVTWRKPRKPEWLDQASYDRLPKTMRIREVRIRVTTPGFRTNCYDLVTTLLDPATITAADLAELYRARWHSELDLRCLKQVLQMDTLRCKTPEMVRKEVWAHLLAYNLIRTVMADAAAQYGVLPRALSFKSALELLLAMAPYWSCGNVAEILAAYEHLLKALSAHSVADRPDRYEPRVKKRRPKNYAYMSEPRSLARKRCLTKRKK